MKERGSLFSDALNNQEKVGKIVEISIEMNRFLPLGKNKLLGDVIQLTLSGYYNDEKKADPIYEKKVCYIGVAAIQTRRL